MLIGYARVSTEDQNFDLQKDALLLAGCAETNIYIDVVSGSKAARAGLDELMKFIRPGDTLVIWKLDRLGRSLKHLMEIASELD